MWCLQIRRRRFGGASAGGGRDIGSGWTGGSCLGGNGDEKEGTHTCVRYIKDTCHIGDDGIEFGYLFSTKQTKRNCPWCCGNARTAGRASSPRPFFPTWQVQIIQILASTSCAAFCFPASLSPLPLPNFKYNQHQQPNTAPNLTHGGTPGSAVSRRPDRPPRPRGRA